MKYLEPGREHQEMVEVSISERKELLSPVYEGTKPEQIMWTNLLPNYLKAAIVCIWSITTSNMRSPLKFLLVENLSRERFWDDYNDS